VRRDARIMMNGRKRERLRQEKISEDVLFFLV
jgi:hypothetical protein